MSYKIMLEQLHLHDKKYILLSDAMEIGILADNKISKLKTQIVEMRTECNKRFSQQLQKIRKLEAEKMLQIQDKLFKDGE